MAMDHKQLVRAAMIAVAASLFPSAASQPVLEVVPLRHRTADELLPVLRLLLEPGGTVSGRGGQLLVRTSPANLAELKHVLATIDGPRQRLRITVRFDDAASDERRGIRAEGAVSSRGGRIDAQAHEAAARTTGHAEQRLQVVEGARARIFAGEAALLGPDGMLHESGTGFDVVPRLSGDVVFLDIAAGKHGIDHQHTVTTTVSGRLGEWIEVGSVTSDAASETRSFGSSARTRTGKVRRVWLMVEELR